MGPRFKVSPERSGKRRIDLAIPGSLACYPLHHRRSYNNIIARPGNAGKTNFGLGIYNHGNFYRFEESSSYWYWSTSDTPPASQCITVQ